jgi:hypothetical protein
MSLINDALRRAKQAQQETPPPPATPLPHFRPVEPSVEAARHGLGLMVPISLGVVALLALLLLWELSRRESSQSSATPNSALTVAARVPHVSEPAANESQPQGLPGASDTAPSKLAVADPTASAATDRGATAVSPAGSGTGNTSVSSVATDSADTNHADVTEVSPPASVPLKLQGIVFNPKRPSALINGRVMFVGDRIRDLRIWAIHPDNVVLTGPSRTNVLSLEP